MMGLQRLENVIPNATIIVMNVALVNLVNGTMTQRNMKDITVSFVLTKKTSASIV